MKLGPAVRSAYRGESKDEHRHGNRKVKQESSQFDHKLGMNEDNIKSRKLQKLMYFKSCINCHLIIILILLRLCVFVKTHNVLQLLRRLRLLSQIRRLPYPPFWLNYLTFPSLVMRECRTQNDPNVSSCEAGRPEKLSAPSICTCNDPITQTNHGSVNNRGSVMLVRIHCISSVSIMYIFVCCQLYKQDDS